MKTIKLTMLIMAFSAISSAQAEGLLPIKQGVYVDANVPCKGAPMADVQGYYGKTMSYGQGSCTLLSVSQLNGGYKVKANCQNPDGSREKWAGVFTVESEIHIKMDGVSKRWCASKLSDLW